VTCMLGSWGQQLAVLSEESEKEKNKAVWLIKKKNKIANAQKVKGSKLRLGVA